MSNRYKMRDTPDFIVEAVQFDPHKQPWPEGIIPHPPDKKPRDMSWGYMDTTSGRIHVLAKDYIATDPSGNRHPVSPDFFRAKYVPVEENATEDKVGKWHIKVVLIQLLKQYESNKKRNLINSTLTCDAALMAIRYEAKIDVIVQIAEDLGIELSEEG